MSKSVFKKWGCRCAALMVALACGGWCVAQNAGWTSEEVGRRLFFTEVDASVMPKQDGLQPLQGSLLLGVEPVKNLLPFVMVQSNAGWLSEAGGHTVYRSPSVGLGLGYRVLNLRSGGSLELRGSYAHGVGDNWRFNSLDGGVYWYHRPSSGHFAPVIGVGFRHMHSRAEKFPDLNNAYVSFGLRF